jgi:hypothetical protein
MMEMFAFGEPLDITTRHPSPWHQLSHSLSPSTLPSLSPSPRRTSSNGSLALATWEQQLAEGCGDVQRSQLVLGPGSGVDDASNTNTSDGEVLRTPKLEAERDQEGHIEYKVSQHGRRTRSIYANTHVHSSSSSIHLPSASSVLSRK